MSKVPPTQTPPAPIPALIGRVLRLKPVRVFLHYQDRRGVLLAGGLSYQAIFAVFAGLWVTFSVAGLYLRASPELQDSLVAILSASVPGLFSSGNGDGAIKVDDLLEASVLGWTGAIALVGLLLTALGWLASGRDAVRTIFGIDLLTTNFVLLKLKDLGSAIGFGTALVVSAALSVFSTAALGFFLELIGFDRNSGVTVFFGTVLGLLLALTLDTVVLAAFFRFVAGIQVPFRRLVGGALLGAVALGLLKALGSTLLEGSGRNPLLASFAVIIGLLIWFNLVCQVILLSAAWIAVGMIDAGIPLDPKAEAARLEREAEERAAAAALRPKGFQRLLQRTKRVGGRR